jgi:hypothetical protein
MEAKRMVSIAQLIVFSLGTFMLILTIIKYYFKKQKFLDFLLWFSIWTMFIVAVLFFQKIKFIGEIVFKLEIMDFFLFIAVIVIFGILYIIYNNIKSLESKFDSLVEHIALFEGKEKFKNKKNKR